MKKKMKQFLAAMMAVAMVLSLCVTAGATGTPQTSVTSADTTYDVTTGDTVTTLAMSGGFNGNSRSEGALPDDPVEVIFPTIPANPGRDDALSINSADTFGVFDIILDPHGLINATNGARYAKTDVTKSFSDSRLYFLKSFTADNSFQRYDGESHALKITNKGRQPINIDLNLDLTYPDEKVNLVSDKASIVTGDGTQSADMYFALKFGTVVSGDATITGDTVVSGGTTSEVSPKPVTKVEDENALPTIKVSGKGDYITAVVYNWSIQSGDEYTALNDALGGVKIKFSYLKAEPIMSGGSAQQGAIKVEPTVPSAYTTTISGGSVSGASGDEVTAAGDVTVSIQSGGTEVANVVVSLSDPSVYTMKTGDDFSQTIQFKKKTTGTVVQVMLDGNENAYDKKWVDPTGNEVDDPQGITTTGYYYKLKEDVEMFPTLSFSLEGDINDNNIWDSVNTQNTGISFNLVWDVMQHSTFYASIASGGELEKAASADVAPTVTVKTKATSSQQLVLEWTPGKGAYADYVPGTTLKVGSKNITLTKNDTAKTLTASGTANTNYTTYANATTKGTITFTATGKDAYPVEITGMR